MTGSTAPSAKLQPSLIEGIDRTLYEQCFASCEMITFLRSLFDHSDRSARG